MDMLLHGKRALVTGSTSGIGAQCARTLAAEGVAVVINGRVRDRAEAVAGEIDAAGGRSAVVLGDVATPEGAEAVAACARAAFGGIDILVNNVGNPTREARGSWFDSSPDEWIADFRQNALATVRLVHALVPAMRATGWGRVIQISSRNAVSPHAPLPAYGAAKAAINNLTLSLSKELAGTGITSNGIMPGLIDTPTLDGWFRGLAKCHAGADDPEAGKAYALEHIVHQTVARLGRPMDVAAAVCFIASPLSDFMTGTTFRIDGGSTPTL